MKVKEIAVSFANERLTPTTPGMCPCCDAALLPVPRGMPTSCTACGWNRGKFALWLDFIDQGLRPPPDEALERLYLKAKVARKGD